MTCPLKLALSISPSFVKSAISHTSKWHERIVSFVRGVQWRHSGKNRVSGEAGAADVLDTGSGLHPL